jgi:hypothetical protein
LIVVSVFFQGGTGQTLTLKDSASNSHSQDVTNTTADGNIQSIYHLANAGAGITYVRGSFSGGAATGFVNVIVSEWNNVATSSPLDVAHCSSGSSSSVTAGSASIGTANDLLIQPVFSDDHGSVSSFAAGSQSNITWRFGATDLIDAAGFQSVSMTNADGTITGTVSGSNTADDLGIADLGTTVDDVLTALSVASQ